MVELASIEVAAFTELNAVFTLLLALLEKRGAFSAELYDATLIFLTAVLLYKQYNQRLRLFIVLGMKQSEPTYPNVGLRNAAALNFGVFELSLMLGNVVAN